MKRSLLTALAVIVLALSSAAQESTPAPITQVPYRPVLMFLPVHVELFGQENIARRYTGVTQKDAYVGVGVGLLAGYPGSFKWQIGISYERFPADKMDLSTASSLNFFDLQVGFRFFPQLPTIGLGRFPVRLTASAMAGGSMISAGQWTPVLKPTATLTAGLAFSYGDNPWGLLVEFIYRPLSMNLTLTGVSNMLAAHLAVNPSWAIRFSWLFSGGSSED